MKVLNLYPDSALAYENFGKLLNKHLRVTGTKKKHHNYHRLFETDKIDFYCVFKKALFDTFFHKFPKFINENKEYWDCKGESLNKEVLEELAKKEKTTYLIFLYKNTDINIIPDRKIINPNLFYKFAEKHDLIRRQDVANAYPNKNFTGEKVIEYEETMHLPFHSNFFKDFSTFIEGIKA